MKNSEKPIYPVVNADGFCTSFSNIEGEEGGAIGLTKRELFAAMALSGIMANNRAEPTHSSHFRNIAEDAVKAADAVLSFLNEP